MPPDAHQPHDFSALVDAIRQADAALAAQASCAVNVSLTLRNWFIGHYIAEFELQGADRAGYGDNLVAELARALRSHAISNCGKRQLYGYLAFYRTYPQIVRTASAQSAQVSAAALLDAKVRTAHALSSNLSAVDPDRLIGGLSYSHLEQLVDLDDPLERSFYETEALRGPWSVRELKRQIATQYYQRSSLSIDKPALSAQAHASAEKTTPQQVIRDPYVFEFLGLKPQETVSEGQLNAYVSYYKRHEMSEGDQPPIGILLCTRKNAELVEYALADMSNQLFVSRYQVQLPTKEAMTAFLNKAVEELGGEDA